jgi:uncharacterized RmlC-like cupin family protein
MSVPEEFVVDQLAGQALAPAGSGLVLAQWTAKGSSGPQPQYQAPLHRHREDEAWYVLSGELRVRIGDDEVAVHEGGAAIVPGGMAHTYWNPRQEPAGYLLVMGAKTYGLIQALHAEPSRDPERVRQLFTEYDAELLE